MRVMKDRISFRHIELKTLHYLSADLLTNFSILYNPKHKILPEDFEQTNDSAKKLVRYIHVFMFKGTKFDMTEDSIEDFSRVFNVQGIKTLKTCVSLDRECIEEFYMSLSELFAFYNLHLDNFIPYTLNGGKIIIETKEQCELYQTIAHYLRLFSIYLNENIPFNEGRERILALDDEGPQVKDPMIRNIRLSMG